MTQYLIMLKSFRVLSEEGSTHYVCELRDCGKDFCGIKRNLVEFYGNLW